MMKIDAQNEKNIYQIMQDMLLVAEKFSEQIKKAAYFCESLEYKYSSNEDKSKLVLAAFGYAKENWEEFSLVPIKESIVDTLPELDGVTYENLANAYVALEAMEVCTTWSATNTPDASAVIACQRYIPFFQNAVANLLNIQRLAIHDLYRDC